MKKYECFLQKYISFKKDKKKLDRKKYVKKLKELNHNGKYNVSVRKLPCFNPNIIHKFNRNNKLRKYFI